MIHTITSLDIETQIVYGKHHPFCISLVTIKNDKKITLLTFNRDSSSRLLEVFFTRLFNEIKFNHLTIFVHNLGRFDGPLLINFFINNNCFKIQDLLYQNNKVLSFKIKWNNKYLTFKDSLKFIPIKLSSLSKLTLNNKKTTLPFNPFYPLVNKIIPLYYVKKDTNILNEILTLYHYSNRLLFLTYPLNYWSTPANAEKNFLSII